MLESAYPTILDYMNIDSYINFIEVLYILQLMIKKIGREKRSRRRAKPLLS